MSRSSKLSPSDRHRVLVLNENLKPYYPHAIHKITLPWWKIAEWVIAGEYVGLLQHIEVIPLEYYPDVHIFSKDGTRDIQLPSVVVIKDQLEDRFKNVDTVLTTFSSVIQADGQCVYCDTELILPYVRLGEKPLLDHVIPVDALIKKGVFPERYRGNRPGIVNSRFWSWDNILPACKDCGSKKSNWGLKRFYRVYGKKPRFMPYEPTYAELFLKYMQLMKPSFHSTWQPYLEDLLPHYQQQFSEEKAA